ncbi:DGQHR domain-containing protein [Rhizobium halophilum]|uniref:DGQHR domain-containing protein n=1 Tax=Rhizobium halophilum TaxID=2846852 RepID=UPI001EFE8029|nr:DGQHR domain-containing protein [Rhizobium halophilum]MCF6370797.1 DGQHR domain-containing protein [Rhizobium halophilum]
MDFADKEFTYEGTTSDFDDIFVWENVIVLVEYTTKRNGHSEHLKKKHFLYDKIVSDTSKFATFLSSKSEDFTKSSASKYHVSKLQFRIIYCTTTDPDEDLKKQINYVKFYDYPTAMYFKALTSSIKKSARSEMLDFLDVEFEDAGENCHTTSGVSRDPFKGSLLPESHSNLGSEYKVVSFYISPEALLERAYVLRKEGWRDSEWLYQRLISQSKIDSIRSYLNSKGRVFLNNIIVTLPSSCRLVDEYDKTIDSSGLHKTVPATIQIPKKFNTIGLIDGQHRVFSYHEGGRYDDKIGPLRKRLNLLVTGIIYPDEISEQDRVKFEAEIFLEINSNQTGAKSDLKHAISSIITPYDPTSIAKRVLTRLNRSGAAADIFVKYFYDKTRLKTTTVISYGVRHLVNLTADGPLFSRWNHPEKQKLLESGKSAELLDQYVEYCFHEIRRWLDRVKANSAPDQWQIKTKDGSGVLNTTTIIGFLNYFRIALSKGIEMNESSYDKILVGISTFQYGDYKSSQYAAMARKMNDLYYPNE